MADIQQKGLGICGTECLNVLHDGAIQGLGVRQPGPWCSQAALNVLNDGRHSGSTDCHSPFCLTDVLAGRSAGLDLGFLRITKLRIRCVSQKIDT